MTTDHISPPPDSAAAPFAGKAAPAQRILVVDDDETIRRYSSELLSRAGYAVATAADGAIAWEALQADNYDLVITDNCMPNVTGVELLQKLHAARLSPRVIMATGRPPEEVFARSPWLRPDVTLLKSYPVDELMAAVKTTLLAAQKASEQTQGLPSGGTRSAPQVERNVESIPGYHVEVHMRYPASVLGYIRQDARQEGSEESHRL